MAQTQDEIRKDVNSLAHTFPIRIAFIGKDTTVKTRVARYLVNTYRFKRKGLSDGLRETLRKFYGYEKFPRISWETRTKYYNALYSVDPTIWIGHYEIRLTSMGKDWWIVCPDARYKNEVDRLREIGFLIVRLEVPAHDSNIGKALMNSPAGSMLLQEWYGEKYKADYTIMINSMKLEDLRQVDYLVRALTKGK